MEWLLVVPGIVLLWVVGCSLTWGRRAEPVPPLTIPAILCATPWQTWMQRQAEIAELGVRFEAAPYPPRGPGSVSPPSRPSPTMSVLSMNEEREIVRLRRGDGSTIDLLGPPPNPGRPTGGWGLPRKSEWR